MSAARKKGTIIVRSPALGFSAKNEVGIAR
jgi:hypothetical protein